MERFGPLYCETPETITGLFPVEPWNAISSGVIVLFGIASLILVVQRSRAHGSSTSPARCSF